MYWSRQFRRRIQARKDARLSSVPSYNVPEIFVDDPEEMSRRQGTTPRDFTDAARTLSPSDGRATSSSFSARGVTPIITTNIRRRSSRDNSPTAPDQSPAGSPSLRPRGLSELDTAYHGARSRSPTLSPHHASSHGLPGRQSPTVGQGVMEDFDNSAWADSIRRSLSVRRPVSGQPPPR